MIETSRRSFLRGILSVGAASLVVKPAALLGFPRIVGDGIHDDADGINALFRGDPVDVVGDGLRIVKGDYPTLSGGIFRITKPIEVVRSFTRISYCQILNDGTDCAILLGRPGPNVEGCVVSNVHCYSNGFRPAGPNTITMVPRWEIAP